MTITYTESLVHVNEAALVGLCGSWELAPSPGVLLRLLAGSAARVLAVDEASGQVVGLLSVVAEPQGYTPLTAVRPAYEDLGVAAEMRRRVLTRLAPGLARYPRPVRAIA